MRGGIPECVEKGRISDGPYGTAPGGRNGAFRVVCPKTSGRLLILTSDASDWEDADRDLGGVMGALKWEHVSVSARDRCPTWEEMCWVKDQFWGPEECVVQFHPPRSLYVNQARYCLHLWRPIGLQLPLPPTIAVGLKA